MTGLSGREIRVLAVDPAIRGFGFAVLEGPNRLIDWGVKETKTDKRRRTLKLVAELIDWYRPSIIVLEDTSTQDSPRCSRVTRLIDDIAQLALKSNVRVTPISKAKVKEAFAECPAQTKYEIAVAIGESFPELAPRVPPFRKPWMSEDYRMSIFDAVGLALGYLEMAKSSANPRSANDYHSTFITDQSCTGSVKLIDRQTPECGVSSTDCPPTTPLNVKSSA